MGSYKNNIKLMYAFNFLIYLHFIGGVLVPFFLNWGKISYVQIMLLQSFFVFSSFIMEIPTGAVADYLGRKLSMTLAAISVGAAAILYSIYPNIYLFFLAEFIWGTGFAFMSGADEALVYDSLKKTRQEKKSKKIFGRYSSFQLLGLMIAAPIGSWIAATIGVRYAMMFMAVPFALACAITFFLKEPKTRKKVESKRYLEMLIGGVKYFSGHKILKTLAFDRTSIEVLVFFAVWLYQPLLLEMKIPLLYFGFIHAAITGIEVVFMNNFEKIEKIFGSRKRYLLWSALIAGICFVLLGLNDIVAITVLLLVGIGAFGLSRPVLFQNYMNKHIESHNRATVISTVSMLRSFSCAVLYPVLGFMVEWSVRYSFMILGGLIIIFALLSRVKEEHLLD